MELADALDNLPETIDLEQGDDIGGEDKLDPARICTALNSLFGEYSSARSSRETIWRVAMILYYSSLDAYKMLAEEAQEVLGQVKTDWRHKTHGPFCFENVETVVGYLMDATFPNEEYFTLDPTKEEDIFRSRVASMLMQKKLSKAEVKKHWEDMYRQQCILGFSVMSMGWEKVEGVQKYREKKEVTKTDALGYPYKETIYVPAERNYCSYDNIKLHVDDPSNIYLDPTASDPNEGGIFRVIPMRLKDILGKMKSGSFISHPIEKIKQIQTELYSQRGGLSESLFQEIQGYGSFNKPIAGSPVFDVLEYYGDFMVDDEIFVDYHVVFFGSLLLKFEPNQYWCGKPHVVGNYIRVLGRPYGMGLVEPNLGYYLLVDVLQNQRLDAFELALNGGILKVKQQCPMDTDDIIVEPGARWDVIEENDITLMELPLDNVRVGREEIAAIVDQIQKAGGNSSYVNAGVARQGERVTGTEVEAVRDAGGNRLKLVQSSGEVSTFTLFLQKAHLLMTQHVDKQEPLRLLGQSKIGRMALQAADIAPTQIALDGRDPSPPEYLFVNAGPEELAGIYEITPKGSSYILGKTERFNSYSQAINLSLSNPLTAAHCDSYEAQVVLYENSGLDGWERFIKKDVGTDQQIAAQKKIQAAMAPPAPPPQADPAAMAAQAGGSLNQQAITDGVADPAVSLGNGAAMGAAVQAGGLEAALQNLSGGAVAPGATQ
jgi:hypothetical protein